MILCVTLNPCLDKTLTVPAWRPGDSVRGESVGEVVGGKGNNVARALSRLGRTARPCTFLGGAVGAHCEDLLRRVDGFDPVIAPTEAPTRVILTVREAGTDGQTSFFDPDPAVSPAEAEDLLKRVERAMGEGPVEALTLSGSSPGEATDGLFLDLVSLARMRRIPVYLDTYGAPLESIWGFWPDVLQLNRREAGLHLRRSDPTDADVLGLLGTWARHGVRLGVVTDGARAVYAQAEGRFYRVEPPAVEAVNPVGSGDCLLAGLVDGRLAGLEAEGQLRRGVACAAANATVWEAGRIDPEEVARLEAEVEVEAIEGEGLAPTGGDRSGGQAAFLRVGVFGRPLGPGRRR